MSKQTVYNILASKPVKVELATIDDLKNQMKSANQGAMQAYDLAVKAESLLEKSLVENQRLWSSFEKALVTAKELGVKPAIDDLNKSMNQVNMNINQIEQMLKAISGVRAF